MGANMQGPKMMPCMSLMIKIDRMPPYSVFIYLYICNCRSGVKRIIEIRGPEIRGQKRKRSRSCVPYRQRLLVKRLFRETLLGRARNGWGGQRWCWEII